MSVALRVSDIAVALSVALASSACASGKVKLKTGPDRATALGQDTKGSGGERCDAGKPGREVSAYDTTGDGRPDVRKVFLSIGGGAEARLVLICRETDVNGDGRKDVIRYYDDDGRSLREEADRNFDGKMDQILIFQNGSVVREELDSNYDGKIDTKLFYEKAQPIRAERDIKGRSSPAQWRPDRWEYYEEGRMVRMGTDLDGDGRVDRWDRDLGWKSVRDKKAEAEAAADGEAAPAEAAPETKAPETGATPAPAATGGAKPAVAKKPAASPRVFGAAKAPASR